MHRATIIAGLLAAVTVAGAPPAAQPQTGPEPCRVAVPQPTAQDLPTDPLQRCATKALAGHFGKLAPWQAAGYTLALGGKTSVKLAWITTYYPQEGFWRGKGCRWGIGTSERVAAANLLPAKTYLWITNPPHLRQVWDTGAKWNDRVARRKGADLWVDLWVPRPGWRGLDTRVAEVVVLSRREVN
ncbi:MAG TPA: hypothetical protein PLJ35_05145 [Anaerolineae bacterium]|nr:hypothetical protein [Anaerolineae bacterium]